MRIEKITKTIEEVKGYRADDGTFFTDRDECLKYERTAKAVIQSMYKKIPKVESSEYEVFDVGYEDNGIDVIYIRDKNDVDAINKYLQFTSDYPQCELLSYDTVGTTQFIQYNCERDWHNCLGTSEQVLSTLEKTLRHLVAKANGEEIKA